MKNYLFILFIAIGFLACDEAEDTLTEKDKKILLLAKRWSFANVLLNETDITDYGYTLSKIEFKNNGTWLCEFGEDLFQPSGTWEFSNDSFTTITMSGIPVSISLQEQGAKLELRFTKTNDTPIGGKTKAVTGDYSVFLLPIYPQ